MALSITSPQPHRVTRRELLIAGAAFTAGLASLAGFGYSPATPPSGLATTPPRRKEVNIITGAEIATLDPTKTNAMENVSSTRRRESR